jgi:hypothetical protein
MSQEETDDSGCRKCGKDEGLVHALVSREPITAESVEGYEPFLLCEEHYSQLEDGDKYHIRGLVPVPDERGGFERTSDDEGMDILYDHDLSDDAWIRFDPDEDEMELKQGKS